MTSAVYVLSSEGTTSDVRSAVFIASVAKLRGIAVRNGDGDTDGDTDEEDGFLKGFMWV